MNIGEKIRALRKSKKITLRELAKKSSVALATLSRIETGIMTGTVKSHQQIASALGIDLPHLYSNIAIEKTAADFQPQLNRTDTFIHNDKASYNMLTSNVLSKKMMPVILNIAPGGITSLEQLSKNTEKFIYVLSGEIKVFVGKETYILKKAQTLYFDASLAHQFKNNSKHSAQAICVISPPAL